MISIVVAVAENGVIGSNNRLPWHLPDDLKRFKALSLGKPIDGVRVVHSLDEALTAAGGVAETVVIGGAEIFRQVLPRTHTIHLTRVHAHVDGDILFPELDPAQWREAGVEQHAADERHQYAFSFVTLQRIGP